MNDRMNHIKEAGEETKKRIAKELHQYYRIVRKALEKLEQDDILTLVEVEILQNMLVEIEAYMVSKDFIVKKVVTSMGDNDYIGLEERGEIRGRQEGRLEEKISLICKKLSKGMSDEEIADVLEEDLSAIKELCEAARKFAPEYDLKAIYMALLDDK